MFDPESMSHEALVKRVRELEAKELYCAEAAYAYQTANVKLTEQVRELEHSNASLRAAVAVHEAYGKRLGEDMTKLRAVAQAASDLLTHPDMILTPPMADEAIPTVRAYHALKAALKALETSDG